MRDAVHLDLHRASVAGVGLYGVVDKNYTGQDKISVVKACVIEDIDRHLVMERFSYLSKEAAQRLMNDLWRTGVRPSQQFGTEGSITLMKDHLSDMRKIVASKLNVEL